MNSNRFIMGKVGNTTIPNYEYSTINEKMRWKKIEIGTEDSKKLEMLVDWVDKDSLTPQNQISKNVSIYDELPEQAEDAKKYDLNYKKPSEDINQHLGEEIQGGNLGNYRLDQSTLDTFTSDLYTMKLQPNEYSTNPGYDPNLDSTSDKRKWVNWVNHSFYPKSSLNARFKNPHNQIRGYQHSQVALEKLRSKGHSFVDD